MASAIAVFMGFRGLRPWLSTSDRNSRVSGCITFPSRSYQHGQRRSFIPYTLNTPYIPPNPNPNPNPLHLLASFLVTKLPTIKIELLRCRRRCRGLPAFTPCKVLGLLLTRPCPPSLILLRLQLLVLLSSSSCLDDTETVARPGPVWLRLMINELQWMTANQLKCIALLHSPTLFFPLAGHIPSSWGTGNGTPVPDLAFWPPGASQCTFPSTLFLLLFTFHFKILCYTKYLHRKKTWQA